MTSLPRRTTPRGGDGLNAQPLDLSLISALQMSFQDEQASAFFGDSEFPIPSSTSTDRAHQRSTYEILGEALDIITDDQHLQWEESPESLRDKMPVPKKHMGPPRQ